MSFTERINNDLKQAMLKREKDRLEAIRAVKTAFTLARTEKGANAELTEPEEIRILQKLVRQRQESAAIYQEQKRMDLYEKEVKEADVIEAYLPAMMSEDAIRQVVSRIVTDTGAQGMKDMGKVMGIATKELAGKADGKTISGIVRDILK